jgi:SmpA/OmlA family protein
MVKPRPKPDLQSPLRHGLLRYATTAAISSFILCGCAEMDRFRSDRNTQDAALVALTERVNELKHRLAVNERASKQTYQELKQAIETLLKKALETENRLSNLESGRVETKKIEKTAKPALKQPMETSRAVKQDQKQLRLGMTQEEVRHLFGEPISIESSGDYIFWQYAQESNQKYVVFEKANGRVSGWLGL